MTIQIDLVKKFELNLQKAGLVDLPVLEVRLALDHSGSMMDEYRDGLVDRFIELFIPAAMKFDDNQSLDVGFFHSGWVEAPSALPADAGNYLATKKPNVDWGGTNYAQIIENTETKLSSGGFFSKFSGGTSKYRGYTAIITDGDSNDHSLFERRLDATSGDTFFEFIAIGTDIRPEYLTGVCQRYPHTNFSHIRDPKNTTDDQFYEFLCNQKFVTWAKAR